MKKCKVLQILGSLGVGGNEMFVMNYFRSIDKTKFQVDFLIFDGTRLDFYDEVIRLGGKVHICPDTEKTFMKQIRYVYQFLKKYPYDVVHCHNCAFKGLLKGTIPAKLAKVPKVISHAHSVGTPKDTKMDNLLRSVLRGCLSKSIDYGFACSDLAGKSKYTKKFMESDRYVYIHNAIEADVFRWNPKYRNEIRNKYGMENCFVIGNVGRLAEEKNQKFLLELLAQIYKKDIQVRLLLVGGGEREKELKELAKELEIENAVIFTGMVNDAERYYSAMDVFVMPSLYEGLPFTAVEAQVNGLRCVMADTITPMVNISGDVVFLSLDEPMENWREVIMSQGENRSSDEKVDEVCQGYDLKQEVKRLESYYEK